MNVISLSQWGGASGRHGHHVTEHVGEHTGPDLGFVKANIAMESQLILRVNS